MSRFNHKGANNRRGSILTEARLKKIAERLQSVHVAAFGDLEDDNEGLESPRKEKFETDETEGN